MNNSDILKGINKKRPDLLQKETIDKLNKIYFKVTWYKQTDIENKINILKGIYNIKTNTKLIEQIISREFDKQS